MDVSSNAIRQTAAFNWSTPAVVNESAKTRRRELDQFQPSVGRQADGARSRSRFYGPAGGQGVPERPKSLGADRRPEWKTLRRQQKRLQA